MAAVASGFAGRHAQSENRFAAGLAGHINGAGIKKTDALEPLSNWGAIRLFSLIPVFPLLYYSVGLTANGSDEQLRQQGVKLPARVAADFL